MLRWVCILLLVTSCTDDQKKYSRLEGLRLLAIVADTPEINAPQTVTLTPYLSYPEGGDTTLNISYEACIDPGISFGAEISCASFPSSEVVSGSLNFSTSTIGSTNAYTGAITPIGIPISATAFGFLSALDAHRQFNGLDMLVIFNIQDAGDPATTLQAVKRITLTSKTTSLNTNPSIGGNFLGNDTPLSAFPTFTVDLSLSGLSSGETYEIQSVEGVATDATELMTVTWFSNVGDFLFSRTAPEKSTEFNPEGNTSGIFVGVYRDNRGGVSLIQRVF